MYAEIIGFISPAIGVLIWILEFLIKIAPVVAASVAVLAVMLARKTLKDADRPEVVVFLRPHEVHIYCLMLCIENVGTGRACDVRFKTDLSFKPDGSRSLEELNFLKNGIANLGRGQKIEHFLVSVIDRLEELKQTPLEITVTYKDSKDSEQTRDFRLDFGELEGLSGIGKAPLVEIADAAKNIDKVLDKNLRHLTSDYTNRGYTFQVGDKVVTTNDVSGKINGDARTHYPIPRGEICTVIQVMGNLVTVELDSARKETGGVVYERVVHISGDPYRSFQLVKMNLLPV